MGAVVSPIIWAFATHKSDAFKYVLDSLTGFMTALPNISLSWSVTVLGAFGILGYVALKAIFARKGKKSLDS